MSLRLSKYWSAGRRGDLLSCDINRIDRSDWPGRLVSQRANLACRHIIEPVIFCLAHVAGMLTRHAVGEKRFQDATRYGYAGLMVGGMIPSAVLLLFAAAPEQFLSLFINPVTVVDDRIIELTKLFLFISILRRIPDANRNIFSFTFNGSNDT